eukprot:6195139-Pleurochrysis_carterae.AAC.1
MRPPNFPIRQYLVGCRCRRRRDGLRANRLELVKLDPVLLAVVASHWRAACGRLCARKLKRVAAFTRRQP